MIGVIVANDGQWCDEKKEMNVVVSVKENPRRILVLRLRFQDFSWELVCL